jgi:hypothetical protein
MFTLLYALVTLFENTVYAHVRVNATRARVLLRQCEHDCLIATRLRALCIHAVHKGARTDSHTVVVLGAASRCSQSQRSLQYVRLLEVKHCLEYVLGDVCHNSSVQLSTDVHAVYTG